MTDASPLAVLPLVFALGLRHGLDADHLAAIDGLSRLRPHPWNGALFALGHGGLVTLLAVGVGAFLGNVDLGWLTPWLFLGLAAVNLARLLRPAPHRHARVPNVAPLVLGVLLAVGFETSSQLSALALTHAVGPLWLGLAFTLGMVCTDGVDGLLASRVQAAGGVRALKASRAMGWAVVAVSVLFGAADLAGFGLDAVALPLGLTLLAGLVGLRLWSLGGPRSTGEAA